MYQYQLICGPPTPKPFCGFASVGEFTIERMSRFANDVYRELTRASLRGSLLLVQVLQCLDPANF